MVGAWQSPFRLRIPNWTVFQRVPLRPIDRMQVVSLTVMKWMFVPPHMQTTVTFDEAAQRVHHTTRISKLGVTLFRSEELIALNDDGVSGVFTGTWASAATMWREQPWPESRVEFDPDGDGAKYAFTWLGQPMRQATRKMPEGLLLSQTTAFSKAAAVLRRVPETFGPQF